MPLALAPLLLVGACDWLWPLEGEYDPHRCDPGCQGAQRCQQGSCVGPGTDGPRPDGPARPKKDGAPGKDTWPLKDSGPTPKKDGKPRVVDKHVPVADKYVPVADKSVPCTGQLLCLGGDLIRICQAGAWTNTTCTAHCQATGFHYALNCVVGSGGYGSCVCAKKTGFGAVCTTSAVCGAGYHCRVPTTWIAGVCTRSCSKDTDCLGGPPGTLALCNVVISTPMGDIKKCEFVCGKHKKPCPANMTCDLTTDLCLTSKLPPP